MKNLKCLAVLFVAVLLGSCSSDSDSNDPDVETNDYMNLTVEGEDIDVPQVMAIRRGENFEILGQISAETGMHLFFLETGEIITATYSGNPDNPFDSHTNAFDFTNHTFTFDIVAIDESAKIIKVTFSGKLFEDPFDQQGSQFKTVSGTTNVHYIEVPPVLEGFGTNATINGTAWHSVNGGLSSSGPIEFINLYSTANDAYRINIYFNTDTTVAGTYNFTPASTNHMVILSKYDVETGLYTDFPSTGTLVISSIDGQVIEGTFNFTAIDPETNATVTVNSGTFKKNY